MLSIRVAALLILVCQGLDWWSTHALLAHHAVEVNPIAKALLVAGWLLVAKVALSVVLLAKMGTRRWAPAGLIASTWAVAGAYTMVVAGNLLTLRMVG